MYHFKNSLTLLPGSSESMLAESGEEAAADTGPLDVGGLS